MKKKLKILALIPARGGSKGIPKKNIRLLAGRPLIEYVITAAQKSELINRIILSTDDPEIAKIGENLNIEIPFLRPKKLAKDTTQMLEVIRHAISFLKEKENYSPDYIILLQPTSPLTKAKHIDEALRFLINENADSVVSVSEVPSQFNPYFILKISKDRLRFFMKNSEKYIRRQDLPRLYSRNGAIYAFKKDLLKQNTIYGRNCRPYIMPRRESINIDEEEDFILAESLIKKDE